MMKNDELYDKLLSAGLTYVSYRLRTEKELTDYIEKKLHRFRSDDMSLVTRVLSRLRELGYIDDRAFSTAFIDSRYRSRPKSRRTILFELRKKGVSEDVAASALGSENSAQTDYDAAKKALERKMPYWAKLPVPERKKKIYGYLLRRGFTNDTVGRVIDEVLEKSYN